MIKDRKVVITPHTLLEIFKDYLGEDEIPSDAKALSFQYHPQERGKLALLCESARFKPSEEENKLVSFQLRQIHALGRPGARGARGA